MTLVQDHLCGACGKIKKKHGEAALKPYIEHLKSKFPEQFIGIKV
jgi:hypothetical protein